MEHPDAIRPEQHAVFNPEKMGKATLFESERILVGLNSFEPGQAHKLHAHEGMDKVYQVVSGEGLFLLENEEIQMGEGEMLIAPEGVPHGVRNTGSERLVVLAILTVLIGIVATAFSGLRERARVGKAEALLERVTLCRLVHEAWAEHGD